MFPEETGISQNALRTAIRKSADHRQEDVIPPAADLSELRRAMPAVEGAPLIYIEAVAAEESVEIIVCLCRKVQDLLPIEGIGVDVPWPVRVVRDSSISIEYLSRPVMLVNVAVTHRQTPPSKAPSRN